MGSFRAILLRCADAAAATMKTNNIILLLKEKKIENAWSLYIRLALMLSFFTVPRRQFQSVIKAIEYSVFFMALYLLVYIGTK